jgi:hypothetical protein
MLDQSKDLNSWNEILSQNQFLALVFDTEMLKLEIYQESMLY